MDRGHTQYIVALFVGVFSFMLIIIERVLYGDSNSDYRGYVFDTAN